MLKSKIDFCDEIIFFLKKKKTEKLKKNNKIKFFKLKKFNNKILILVIKLAKII